MKIIRCCLLWSALAGQAAFAQDYEIHLHRPQQVGQKYTLSASGKQSEDVTVTADGKKVQSKKREFSVELEAEVTVLAVGKSGKSIKHSLSIDRLTRTEDGQLKLLVGGSSKVIASYENGKKVFIVNDGPADLTTREALSLVSDLEKDGSTDDDLFGTKDRKKVGESWPVNGTQLAQDLTQESPMQIEKVSGKGTLKEVVKEAGGPVLIIVADAQATPASPAPGLKVESASMTFHATGRFPVDLSLGRPEDSVEMTFSMHATGTPQAGGPAMEMKADMKQSAVMKRKYLH